MKSMTNEALPEWWRMTQATAETGIPRGTLYKLINQGHIVSVALAQPKGTRLIKRESLLGYLNRLAKEQAQSRKTAA